MVTGVFLEKSWLSCYISRHHRCTPIHNVYFAAQLSDFDSGFEGSWSCSLHSCSTYQSRTSQSTCSELGSPEYLLLLAWRRGWAQHTTTTNQNPWLLSTALPKLAFKWEITNLLHQAISMWLLPAWQSPHYSTQINSFATVHLSIMRGGWAGIPLY